MFVCTRACQWFPQLRRRDWSHPLNVSPLCTQSAGATAPTTCGPTLLSPGVLAAVEITQMQNELQALHIGYAEQMCLLQAAQMSKLEAGRQHIGQPSLPLGPGGPGLEAMQQGQTQAPEAQHIRLLQILKHYASERQCLHVNFKKQQESILHRAQALTGVSAGAVTGPGRGQGKRPHDGQHAGKRPKQARVLMNPLEGQD